MDEELQQMAALAGQETGEESPDAQLQKLANQAAMETRTPPDPAAVAFAKKRGFWPDEFLTRFRMRLDELPAATPELLSSYQKARFRVESFDNAYPFDPVSGRRPGPDLINDPGWKFNLGNEQLSPAQIEENRTYLRDFESTLQAQNATLDDIVHLQRAGKIPDSYDDLDKWLDKNSKLQIVQQFQTSMLEEARLKQYEDAAFAPGLVDVGMAAAGTASQLYDVTKAGASAVAVGLAEGDIEKFRKRKAAVGDVFRQLTSLGDPDAVARSSEAAEISFYGTPTPGAGDPEANTIVGAGRTAEFLLGAADPLMAGEALSARLAPGLARRAQYKGLVETHGKRQAARTARKEGKRAALDQAWNAQPMPVEHPPGTEEMFRDRAWRMYEELQPRVTHEGPIYVKPSEAVVPSGQPGDNVLEFRADPQATASRILSNEIPSGPTLYVGPPLDRAQGAAQEFIADEVPLPSTKLPPYDAPALPGGQVPEKGLPQNIEEMPSGPEIPTRKLNQTVKDRILDAFKNKKGLAPVIAPPALMLTASNIEESDPETARIMRQLAIATGVVGATQAWAMLPKKERQELLRWARIKEVHEGVGKAPEVAARYLAKTPADEIAEKYGIQSDIGVTPGEENAAALAFEKAEREAGVPGLSDKIFKALKGEPKSLSEIDDATLNDIYKSFKKVVDDGTASKADLDRLGQISEEINKRFQAKQGIQRAVPLDDSTKDFEQGLLDKLSEKGWYNLTPEEKAEISRIWPGIREGFSDAPNPSGWSDDILRKRAQEVARDDSIPNEIADPILDEYATRFPGEMWKLGKYPKERLSSANFASEDDLANELTKLSDEELDELHARLLQNPEEDIDLLYFLHDEIDRRHGWISGKPASHWDPKTGELFQGPGPGREVYGGPKNRLDDLGGLGSAPPSSSWDDIFGAPKQTFWDPDLKAPAFKESRPLFDVRVTDTRDGRTGTVLRGAKLAERWRIKVRFDDGTVETVTETFLKRAEEGGTQLSAGFAGLEKLNLKSPAMRNRAMWGAVGAALGASVPEDSKDRGAWAGAGLATGFFGGNVLKTVGRLGYKALDTAYARSPLELGHKLSKAKEYAKASLAVATQLPTQAAGDIARAILPGASRAFSSTLDQGAPTDWAKVRKNWYNPVKLKAALDDRDFLRHRFEQASSGQKALAEDFDVRMEHAEYLAKEKHKLTDEDITALTKSYESPETLTTADKDLLAKLPREVREELRFFEREIEANHRWLTGRAFSPETGAKYKGRYLTRKDAYLNDLLNAEQEIYKGLNLNYTDPRAKGLKPRTLSDEAAQKAGLEMDLFQRLKMTSHVQRKLMGIQRALDQLANSGPDVFRKEGFWDHTQPEGKRAMREAGFSYLPKAKEGVQAFGKAAGGFVANGYKDLLGQDIALHGPITEAIGRFLRWPHKFAGLMVMPVNTLANYLRTTAASGPDPFLNQRPYRLGDTIWQARRPQGGTLQIGDTHNTPFAWRQLAIDHGLVGSPTFLGGPQTAQDALGDPISSLLVPHMPKAVEKGGRVGKRALQAAQNLMSYNDDIFRLAHWVDLMEGGLSPKEAAKKVLDFHPPAGGRFPAGAVGGLRKIPILGSALGNVGQSFFFHNIRNVKNIITKNPAGLGNFAIRVGAMVEAGYLINGVTDEEKAQIQETHGPGAVVIGRDKNGEARVVPIAQIMGMEGIVSALGFGGKGVAPNVGQIATELGVPTGAAGSHALLNQFLLANAKPNVRDVRGIMGSRIQQDYETRGQAHAEEAFKFAFSPGARLGNRGLYGRMTRENASPAESLPQLFGAYPDLPGGTIERMERAAPARRKAQFDEFKNKLSFAARSRGWDPEIVRMLIQAERETTYQDIKDLQEK